MNLDLVKQAENQTEILDLVDEQDRVLGQVVRAEAHQDPKLIHREIGIILVNSQKQIMLQKRSQYKTVNPSTWSITAGHVPAGQDPSQVAHQELAEELGFDTELIFLVKRLNTYSWESHFMYYYLGLYNEEPISLSEAEVEKVQLFSQDELAKLVASSEKVNPTHLPLFENFWQGEYQSQLQKLST